MGGLTFIVTVDSSGFKPKCFHEKVVCSEQILVNEDRDHTVETSHGTSCVFVRLTP